MKYKVRNKLEQRIRFGSILFEPNETKILDVKPESDRFEVTIYNQEEIEKKEEPKKKTKGGK